MKTLWLHIRAPFAAFRYFQAGVYRQTSPTIPHTAAWGLLLNCASIESRINQDEPITEIDPSAPTLEIAVGALRFSETGSLYQQLHTYPVGSSGKEFKARAKGTKYWIAPARREFLVDLDVVVGARTTDETLLQRIENGLSGELNIERYGLPFAGDNNFLFDSIDVLREPCEAYWYEELQQVGAPRKGSCRLTTSIDRKNSSKTKLRLFAPTNAPQLNPPQAAWVSIPS